MELTKSQFEIAHSFFEIMNESIEDVDVHPVIERRTGAERLAICMIIPDERDVSGDTVMYVPIGILYNENDPLREMYKFKEDITAGDQRSRWQKIKEWFGFTGGK